MYFVDHLVIETKGLQQKEKKHIYNNVIKKKLLEHNEHMIHDEDEGWVDNPFKKIEKNEIHLRIDGLVDESFEHFGFRSDEHVINRSSF